MENLQIIKNAYNEISAKFIFEGMNISVEQGRGEFFFKRVDYNLDQETSPSRKIVADSLINYNYVANQFVTPWTCDAFKVSADTLLRLKKVALDVMNQMGYL